MGADATPASLHRSTTSTSKMSLKSGHDSNLIKMRVIFSSTRKCALIHVRTTMTIINYCIRRLLCVSSVNSFLVFVFTFVQIYYKLQVAILVRRCSIFAMGVSKYLLYAVAGMVCVLLFYWWLRVRSYTCTTLS